MKLQSRWVHIFLTISILCSNLAFSLASAQPAAAQSGTWYVSTIGSDVYTCNTPESPCLTINAAIAKAADGDTIQVAVGIYNVSSGDAVVQIGKSITLSGGWNESFTTRGGRSIIDGGREIRGIEISIYYPNYPTTIIIDHFIIQNGFAENSHGGGIYVFDGWNSTLTLSNSIVRRNVSQRSGGGISNRVSTLNIYNTTISDNRAGALDGNEGTGGGIENDGGTLTLDNSTVSGNKTIAFSLGYGSGILSDDTVILNNSTVSGNTNAYEGIKIYGGTLILNNSTVTNHKRGVTLMGGTFRLQNSILAGNGTKNGTDGDCKNDSFYKGKIISQGYNLIGNNQECPITPATGDLIGTSSHPIDPGLGLLQNNGGLTFTHALLSGSPALNAGNPAEPGSAENACLPTDQRGIARPEGSICDTGAYEVDTPLVASIKRLDPGFTAAASVRFSVNFTESVTGINMVKPFSDFALTTSGVKGAKIMEVSGSESSYTVMVNTGAWSENGTIRLDVVDDGSILDTSGKPLGGPGAGNGNFTSGQVYTLKKIPNPLLPQNTILDRTPTFQWTTIGGAAKYQLTLLKESKIVYTTTVPASACGASRCKNTPATKLMNAGKYTWKVRAWVDGKWQSHSTEMAFEVFIPRPGFWQGKGIEFYVTTASTEVDNFAIYIYVDGCGSYKISYNRLLAITKKKFSFTERFYATGTFTTPTKASGTLGLWRYYIPGCGYVGGGPFPWTAVWKNSSQPTMAVESEDGLTITLLPDLQLPGLQLPSDSFTVEPVE